MEHRDALYYPYIHVRNINWLKGTLLCFPHVVRMTPRGFRLKDEKQVRKFSKTLGMQNRPLLDEVPIHGAKVSGAQRRFLNKLHTDYDEIGVQLHEKFSLVRTRKIMKWGRIRSSFIVTK